MPKFLPTPRHPAGRERTMTKTISYADQLKASRQLYENALSNIETMSDGELRNLFASAATVERVLGIASAGRIAPDFYASDKAALADIRRCAELQS